MIPYFQILQLKIGPIAVQSWGTLVALGFLAAILFCWFYLKRKKLNPEVVWDFGLAGIVCSIIFARLFHAIFYNFSYYLEHPVEIFYLWEPGYSLYGGMLGVFIGAIIVIKWRKLDFWPHADAIAVASALGLTIGRVGCFLIHDHPGIPTTFFLGVKSAAGTNWDLGLMESLAMLLLFIAFLLLMRRPRVPGFYAGAFLVYYGAVRFALDFLRAWHGPFAEMRFAALTPAQYFSIIVLIFGLIILIKRRKCETSSL